MTPKPKKLPQGFTCECGEQHRFSAYVYGHWSDDLLHTCQCGRRHVTQSGKVRLLTQRAPRTEISKLYPKLSKAEENAVLREIMQ